MVRQFENKTNSLLFLEKTEKTTVIIGNYNNENEIYENKKSVQVQNIEDIVKKIESNKLDYKIVPSGDGYRFNIVPIKNYNENIPVVVRGYMASKEIAFDRNIDGLITVGQKICFKNYSCLCENVSAFIYTVEEIAGNLAKIKTPLLKDHTGEKPVTFDDFDVPSWIYQGVALCFESPVMDIHYDVEEGDGTITHVATEQLKRIYAKVTTVSTNPIDAYFIVDDDTRITNNEINYKILGNNNQNKKDIVSLNELNGKINFPLKNVNNGDFVKCTNFYSEDGSGLLLYDTVKTIKTGKISISSKSNIVKGHKTKFRDEFNQNDYVLFGNSNTKHKVKNIISNDEMILEDTYNSVDLSEVDIFIVDSDYESIHSIIYDVYDDTNNNSQGNFKNIMPIRGGRTINFKFGAGDLLVRNVKGDTFSINKENFVNDYTIYKIFVNGNQLLKKEYEIKDDNSIVVKNKTFLKKYNNYLYIIYYLKEQPLNSYAFLEYNGYRTSFPSKNKYLDGLYKFLFYFNFSESMSNNYYEYNDDILDSVKRRLTDKNHTLTFSSYITNDGSNTDNKILTNDVSSIVNYNTEFRLIRYNNDTKTFYVYNSCKLVNPASDTMNDDANIITYTINFKDKITIVDREFGDGDWGRFELFGLKILSIC